MSRRGLLQSLRELWKGYKNYGRPELESLRRQAENLRQDVELLKAVRERNEARERELMTSLKDYGEYIRMVALVKQEQQKRADIVASNVCKHVEVQEYAAQQEKALAEALGAIEVDQDKPANKQLP